MSSVLRRPSCVGRHPPHGARLTHVLSIGSCTPSPVLGPPGSNRALLKSGLPSVPWYLCTFFGSPGGVYQNGTPPSDVAKIHKDLLSLALFGKQGRDVPYGLAGHSARHAKRENDEVYGPFSVAVSNARPAQDLDQRCIAAGITCERKALNPEEVLWTDVIVF